MTISLPHKNDQLDLDTELSRLRNLEKVITTTEKLSKIGHYEWDWDRDCLSSCSEEYARIFGMTVPQIMEAQSSWENTLKQIVPDDVECYTQAARVISDTGRLDIKYRILLNDNTIKHIRELSIVKKDPGKLENSSLGILQDIIEQVNRERDLEYREELSQQAESITDIGHYIYDELNENYSFLSEGCARIYGTTVEAYMAKMQSYEDDLADIHPDDRERVVSEYEHYLKGTEECPIEYRIIRSNGQVRWIRELAKALRFEDGKVVETLGVVQDITMQVDREQELLFKEAIVSEVEVVADIGYFLFDEKKDKNILVSPGVAKILGLDIDTFNEKIVTGNDFIALVFEEDQALVRKAYEHDTNKEGQWELEYRVVKPDGNLCWIHEIGKSFKRGASGIEQSIGFVKDITNQKLIEQELLYKDALANQAETITDIGILFLMN